MRSVVACAPLLYLVLCLASIAQGAEPIKVGVFISLSGPGAYVSDPFAKTIQLEVEKINHAGGILGRPLKIILYDDQSDTKQAVSFARKLVDQDKVDVLLGGTLTGATMAVIPLTEEAEIPLISLAGATVIVEPVKKWVFKPSYTDRTAVEKDYIDMQKRQITKIALIGGSVGFDESCRKEARNLAPKYGISILADETWAPSDTDMTPQLTKIRETKDVQALLNCGTQSPAAISVRNFQRLGLKIPLYFSHGIVAQDFLEAAGAAMEGVRAPLPAAVVAEQLSAKDPQKKTALEYQKDYQAAYHKPISIFGCAGYDALLLYKFAVIGAGSTDKTKVRDTLENLKNVAGVNGIYNLSPTDHMGLTADAFRMGEVRNGAWKLLY